MERDKGRIGTGLSAGFKSKWTFHSALLTTCQKTAMALKFKGLIPESLKHIDLPLISVKVLSTKEGIGSKTPETLQEQYIPLRVGY